MSERACGSCTMCCKLLHIDELDKPADVWCPHAAPGKGCTIYAERPQTCRTFRCFWLDHAEAPDAWRPDRCGFVMSRKRHGVLMVFVDHRRADAWRRQPYYGQIKTWSRAVLTGKGGVIVQCGGEVTAVFPDLDLKLAIAPRRDDKLSLGYEKGAALRRPFVRLDHADGTTTMLRG